MYGIPAERPQLGCVDGIALIVTKAVGDWRDKGLITIEEFQNSMC